MITEKFFDSPEALLQALTTEIGACLNKAVSVYNRASFLVSGGSSPEPLYKALSATPLNWQQITVALVDERWVNPDNPASNQAFIQASLLQNLAKSASFVTMKTDATSASSGLNECEQRYQNIGPPWDILLLGMGKDGHIASLFPFAAGLETALDINNPSLCTAINANPSETTGAHTQRMSLSLNGILNAGKIILFISGENKLKTYRRARSGTVKTEELPVCAIVNQDTIPVTVFWAP